MLPSTSEWGLRFGFVFKKKNFQKKKKQNRSCCDVGWFLGGFLVWFSIRPSIPEGGFRFVFFLKKKILKKKKKTKSKSLRRGLEIGCLLIVYRGRWWLKGEPTNHEFALMLTRGVYGSL